ncbi:MAG: hypothetical protein Kow0092_16490 [Deferrisomatales bacterium]
MLPKDALNRADLVSARSLPGPAPARWDRAALAGRLTELSAAGASAGLTLACALVLDAQQHGEPVAWIATEESAFYPPDVAEGGVDLDALAVVRVPRLAQTFRAADHLARSGAFGLLVLDLGERPRMPAAAQSRLAGLAGRHDTSILCLTRKDARDPSLGSLVSLRGEAVRERRGDNRLSCRVHILKDKRRGPGWEYEEVCRGPDGLR